MWVALTRHVLTLALSSFEPQRELLYLGCIYVFTLISSSFELQRELLYLGFEFMLLFFY
jgi:hypothetical protein